MSIFAYVGFPGSGKSYSVVEQQIIPALRAGRTVVTNMPMKYDLVKAEVGGDLRPFDISRALADPNTILEDIPAGAVWVVDEVYKLFPAGISVAKVPDPFKQILAEHRHRVDASGNAMQVVFVCQDLAQVAAFARQLVETTFRTTKLTALGLHKRFRVDVFNGGVSGANPPVQARLREIAGRYDPKVYRYYISHTLSESGKEGANEVAIDKRANVLRRPIVAVGLVFVVVAVWFGVHTLSGEGKRLKVARESGAHGGVMGLQTFADHGAASALAAPARGAVAAQKLWFVKGYVINEADGSKSVALLEAGDKDRMVRPLDKCVLTKGEPTRCEVEGRWYSETGPVADSPFGGPVAPYTAGVSR